MTMEEFAELLTLHLFVPEDRTLAPTLPVTWTSAVLKNLIVEFCNHQHIAGFVTIDKNAAEPNDIDRVPPALYLRLAILWRELKRAEAARQDSRIATSQDTNAGDLVVYAHGPAAEHLLAMLTALEQVTGQLLLNRAPKA